MADVYIHSVDGDDISGTGTSEAPWQSLSRAFTGIGANDTIYIHHADGTPYVETSQITTSVESPRMVGIDNAAYLASDLDNYSTANAPRVRFDHGGIGIRFSHASTFVIRGVILDANHMAYECWGTTTTNAVLIAYDSEFINADVSLARGVRVREGSEFHRCAFRGNRDGALLMSGTAIEPVTFYVCEFTDNLSFAVAKNSAFVYASAYNCTAYGNHVSTTGEDVVFEYDTNNWIIQNTLVVDNYCRQGLSGSTHTTSNCYTSDAGTYHYDGNWQGATDADDYSHPPLFLDEDNGDFHLSPSSALLGLGSAVGMPRLFDRRAMPSPPPIGALGAPAEGALVVRGTHRLFLTVDGGYFDATHTDVNAWTLSGVDRPPWVATATLSDASEVSGETVYSELTLTTDRPMLEAETYTLTTELPLHDDTEWSPEFEFTGMRTSLQGGSESSPGPLLLDYHAPLVREDGVPGGFFEIGDDGDYVLTGGIESVKKAVWAWLLTSKGRLFYAPEFGSPLQLKRKRPADLQEVGQQLARGMAREIPWVDSARVTLGFKGNHLRVHVVVRAFGETINESRTVAG